jgi:anti-anti-sigma factor
MLTIAPRCDWDVERGPDWLIVRVRNLSHAEGEASLAERLWTLMRQHLTHRLVLDLDELSELDDYALEELAQLYTRIARHEGVLRLCGLSAKNRQALHACQLDEELPPYADRREAVMASPHWPKPR